MAVNKKSFILYSDLITVVEKLINKDRENNTNYSGELFFHILQYVNDKDPVAIDFIVEMAFEPVKQQLKRDLKRYENIREKRSEAGKISAELRRQKSTNPTSVDFAQQCSTNPTVNDNDTVNVNDTVTVTDNDINILLGAEAQKKTDDHFHEVEYPDQKKEKEKSSAKKEKDFGKSEFRQALIDEGADHQHIEDWFKVRISSKAPFTRTSLNRFLNECRNNNYPVHLAVQACAEYSWRGFEYQWILNKQKYATGKPTISTAQSRQERVEEVRELRIANQQALADRLSKYTTSNPE